MTDSTASAPGALDLRETATDSPAAHALLAEYFASRAADFPADQGSYVTTFPDPAAFTPSRGVFVVASSDGVDVGCGGIRMLDADVVRYEIKHLYLRAAARGRGWGGAVLDDLIRRAIAFGAEEIVLDTNASLTSAAGLYRSRGFVDTEPYNTNPNATNWYRKPVEPARS